METMLRSRVAKLKKQTNSNLLGMVLALLLPQCIQLVVGRAPGPIFFLGGPARAPHEVGAQALKLDRSQALGYTGI